MRQMLIEAYHEIVPEGSPRGEVLCRKLAEKLVAKGGRILIGPKPAPRYQQIHHSVDAGGRILWTDKDWHEVMGFPKRMGLGRRFIDLLAPSSQTFWQETVWPSLLRERRLGPVVLHVMTAVGVMLPATWRGETMLYSDGTFHRTFERLRVLLPAGGLVWLMYHMGVA